MAVMSWEGDGPKREMQTFANRKVEEIVDDLVGELKLGLEFHYPQEDQLAL